jgi:aspartate aminotransferase-like enzyme
VLGDGFVGMIQNFGGKPVILKEAYDHVVSPTDVERALEKNKEIKVATFVHCETPAGKIGDLAEVGKVCNDHNVILIPDTVSTLGGTPLNADRNHIDVCLGASQKCFSAPPGLAAISVSKRAWEKIERRKERVSSFYLNLKEWKDSWLGRRIFSYTQSVSDIFGLDKAVDLLLKEGLASVYERHLKVAKLVRKGCQEMGIDLFPASTSISSPTVTALKIPKGIEELGLRTLMEKKYNVCIAGSWGKLSGKVIRLGHMGYNAYERKAEITLEALEKSLSKLGFRISK